MHGRFVFIKLAKYPHMKPRDVEIWERFIEKNKSFFDTVDYDFHVGEGADFLPTGEDTPDGRENRLYQRKIDVVGYRGDKVWLIEVKPEASASALGQILSYKELYIKTKDADPLPTLMVVTGKIMSEMKEVYAKHNIAVFVA